MNDIAIRVENLSKLYRIGQIVGYKTLGESIVNVISAPFRRFRSTEPSAMSYEPSADTIWALKDVSFEVKQGEAIGIIGPNGAGKTTLLKILTRITTPTEGYAEIHGRVGSLLEVGTGFHPELTGQENIYLSGAVLGMKKKEIDRRFDEIVDFAGEVVEKFIDTPLKRYSSGMQVRLAFAVAAHLEPEILLVDEVLAVGDAEFQKKCLGKMEGVAKGGRTVLFVSHNLASITNLCQRAILLGAGKVVMDGQAAEVVESYLQAKASATGEVIWGFEDAPGSDVAKVHAVRILNSKGEVSSNHDAAEPVTLEMEFWVLRNRGEIHPTFHLYNTQGIRLFGTASCQDPRDEKYACEPGLYRCCCTIPGNYLNRGQHWLSAFLNLNKTLLEARMDQVVSFSINDLGRTRYVGVGAVRPLLPWTMRQIEEPRQDKHVMKIHYKGG